MKRVYLDQNTVDSVKNASNQQTNLTQTRFTTGLLSLLVILLYFFASFLPSYFSAFNSLGILILEAKVRLSFSLVSVITLIWLATSIYQKPVANFLTTLISFTVAIAIQQTTVQLFPNIFPNSFWVDFIFDAFIPLTITILSWFALRLSSTFIEVRYDRRTSNVFQAVGLGILTLAATLGAYACIWIWIKNRPQSSPDLTGQAIAIVSGVIFSYLIVLSSWAANRFRNAAHNPEGVMRSLALSLACWKKPSFRDQDLSGVNFSNANLAHLDLRAQKLYRTSFLGAIGLEKAKVDSRYLDLELPKVQQLLTCGASDDKDLSRLNLRGACLQGADLRRCNLTNTELTGADLRGADLRGAILVRSQVMNVDFTDANLTGICNKDWSINGETCFTDVECDYIYRDLDKKGEPIDRYPLDRNFEPKEFEALYQEVGNVVNLVFKEGVNWRAFSFGMEKLQLEDDGLDLKLKGFERRGDRWVVKVTHNENASKQQVEVRLSAIYEEMKQQLSAKEGQINELLGIVSNQAETMKGISQQTFGNHFFISGSTITNLAGSGQIEYHEAAEQVRSLVASSSDSNQVLSILRSFMGQLRGQNVATQTGTQLELIQQVILSEAAQDPEFKKLLLEQGQQMVDSLPTGEIAIAVQSAIAQLNS